MSSAPGIRSARSTPRDRIQLATSLVRPSIVLVTAGGVIDAANALELSKHVENELHCTGRLIVDLRALDFFGIQGFSILHRINVMCSRYAVNWVMLAGPEVDRVLDVCDPDGGLPVADTPAEAVAAVSSPPSNHLRLVPSV